MPQNFVLAAARCAALLAILLSLPGEIRAGTVAEDHVKAGFILNFAKYVEWPAAVLIGGELRICGMGAQPLSGRLAQLQGRQVIGLGVKVRTQVRPEEWRNCNVLFIPDSELHHVQVLLRTLAEVPVLTVSDSVDFAQDNGMIGLKLRVGRVRFDINLGAARQSGLSFSSHLLKLADTVLP